MDFVQLWVDNNDPQWQAEFHKYAALNRGDKRDVRFRDWDNLKYWFRGVEKFAPWVEKVHLVTCGHYPAWLNLEHPKLNFVRHSDFIPGKYLPTFNVNTIELNLHRIKGLSEQFVYFNDDLFLIGPVSPERFFRGEMPCDMAVGNALSTNEIASIIFNDLRIINKYFDKKKVVSSAFFKWYNVRYGSLLFRTLLLSPWPKFTGFVDPHLPNAFLKTTFEEIWSYEPQQLEVTCSHRFRNLADVNQYLFRYWQLVKSDFTAINVLKKASVFYLNDENVVHAADVIRKQKSSIICLNDGEIKEFLTVQKLINDSLEVVLPDKSSFEL